LFDVVQPMTPREIVSAVAVLSRRIVAALSQDPPDDHAYRQAWSAPGIGAPGKGADPQVAGSLLAAWANGSYLLVDVADLVLPEEAPQTAHHMRRLYHAAAGGDPQQLESLILEMLELENVALQRLFYGMAMGYVLTARCCGGLTRMLDIRSVVDQVGALDGDRAELANLASLAVAAMSGPDGDEMQQYPRLVRGLHLVAARPGGGSVLSELVGLLVRVTARVWESSATGRAVSVDDPRFPPWPSSGEAGSSLHAARTAVVGHLGVPGEPPPAAQAIRFLGDPAEVTAEQVVAIMWAGLAAGQQVDAVIQAAWQRQSDDLDPDQPRKR
jgi:hypothetical protein